MSRTHCTRRWRARLDLAPTHAACAANARQYDQVRKTQLLDLEAGSYNTFEYIRVTTPTWQCKGLLCVLWMETKQCPLVCKNPHLHTAPGAWHGVLALSSLAPDQQGRETRRAAAHDARGLSAMAAALSNASMPRRPAASSAAASE